MSCSLGRRQNVEILHYWWKTGAQDSNVLQNSSRITITSNLQSSSLLISSVTARDSGLYVCEIVVDKTSLLYTYTGNGSHLLVTVTPVISLWIEEEKALLICEAQRFYPQNLTILWSFSLMETQSWDNVTENEDRTYTKRSTVKITSRMWGQSVTCCLEHRSLTAPLSKSLNLYGSVTSLYHQLFPVRVLMTLILILSPLICQLYIHFAK
ncbi:tapasin-related -like [Pelobates cultripes]|uniref:Tapasin-related -like n=1 Tax=Pelobates cultripes TaxID=61616 RepID=A0AAD1VJT7_PELCU|nr:tapasin-related -like [Pelobates cultripes]